MGKTLITDLDPMAISKDGSTFFADSYDAHFDDLGFLEKLVFDKAKGHAVPATWNLDWNTDVNGVQTALSVLGKVEVVHQDMSKSRFADAFSDVTLTINSRVYHFQVIDWKDNSGNQDGLSSIVITAQQ